jgi:hypothetical protein
MADKDNALVPADPATDLAVFDGSMVGVATRPQSLDPNDVSGTENIDADEVKLPRIGIAQGLSPQMTPGDTQYIDSLKLFMMFNDQTNEVYGHGPMTFVPIRRDVRRIEFTPRSEGGGVVDLDVPKSDPRLKWTKSDPSLPKADVPPAATEFVEFVVLLLRKGKAPEPIMLSIATKNKWNRRAADKITSVSKIRRAPIYANLFSIDTSIPGKNDKGTFGVPTVRDLGFIPKDTPAGGLLYAHCEAFHRSLEGKVIVVQREPGEDPTDFDTNAMEHGTAAAGTSDM